MGEILPSKINAVALHVVYREGDGPVIDEWGERSVTLRNYIVVPDETWTKLKELADAKADDLAAMLINKARTPPRDNWLERNAGKLTLAPAWLALAFFVVWTVARAMP